MVIVLVRVTFQPDGVVTASSRAVFTYSLNGDRLTIRSGENLLILRPAAPRKP
jgi:hypothetical protein